MYADKGARMLFHKQHTKKTGERNNMENLMNHYRKLTETEAERYRRFMGVKY